MSNETLRLTKDKLTAKLQLALFTESVDDNKDLAERVARLETEFAGVALFCNRRDQAFHALCAAAAAHRELGDLQSAEGCLERARGFQAGDAETKGLLLKELSDLRAKLAAAKPKPAPVAAAPKPAPAPKLAPRPAKPAPKPAKSADKAPEPKRPSKKQAPKRDDS